VTLGRDRRGADWRASRPAAGHDDRRGSDRGTPRGGNAPWGGVEVEELPAQPVLASGRGRPGLSAIVAAGVLLLILAAGLGVLGGRPAPSPSVPAVAAASPAPSGGPAIEFGPRVTPAVPCAPRTDAVPELQLEADGRSFAGVVEVLERDDTAPAPTPALVPLPVIPSAPATIDVRSDLVTLIRTIGDVCATSWQFDLSSPDESIGLEGFTSPDLDPDRAQQNQFALDLAAYRGREFDLSGLLTFPGFRIQASWPIRILRFDPPNARLTLSGKEIDVEPGCDLQLILDTGYTELVNPCEVDLAEVLDASRISAPNSFLTFQFPVNWYLPRPTISCGSLTQGRFQLDEGCEISWTDEGTSLRILLPGAEGTWSLAINGCATELLSDVTNQVCGTWYATVEVRPKPG